MHQVRAWWCPSKMHSWGHSPSSPLLSRMMSVGAMAFPSPPTPSKYLDGSKSSRLSLILDSASMWTSPEESTVKHEGHGPHSVNVIAGHSCFGFWFFSTFRTTDCCCWAFWKQFERFPETREKSQVRLALKSSSEDIVKYRTVYWLWLGLHAGQSSAASTSFPWTCC